MRMIWLISLVLLKKVRNIKSMYMAIIDNMYYLSYEKLENYIQILSGNSDNFQDFKLYLDEVIEVSGIFILSFHLD